MMEIKQTNKITKGLFGLFATVTLAVGVGVAIAPREVVKTEAADTTISFVQADVGLVWEASSTGTTVNSFSKSGVNFAGFGFKTKSSASATSGYGYIMLMGGSLYNTSYPVDTFVKSIKITYTSGTGISGSIVITMGSSLLSTRVTTGGTAPTKSGYLTKANAVETNKYFNISNTNTSNTQIASVEVVFSPISGGGEPTPATSVSVSAAGGATTVKVGKTLQLSAVVNPGGAVQTVTWSSSAPLVASVNPNTGIVTGVASGNVTITATSTTPGISGQIALVVPEPVVYDGGENFESTSIPTSYGDGTFIGSSGITFNFYASRDHDTFPIDGKGLLLRRIADSSRLDFTLSNGISAIKFDWLKAYGGAGNRQIDVYINGTEVATTEALDLAGEIQTFEHTLVTPQSGSVAVSIRNKTANQVVIDNLEWNNGPVVIFGTLDSLEVNANAVKRSYYEGETLSLSGLVAMAYDTDGKDKNVTANVSSNPADGYVFTPADANVGTKTITISYTEGVTVSDTFDVTVIAIIQPEHLVSNIGTAYSGPDDSGTVIALETDLKSVFTGEKISLLETAIVQIDPGDSQSRMYYAGTNFIKGGVQPLKFGSGKGKGNVKFTFTDEIRITKVTLYAARLGSGTTNATFQVNSEAAKNIGAASTIDVMFAPYEFEGAFGHELVIRTNTNIATYLYGIDIEYKTYEEDALAFANEVMTGSGNLAHGSCDTVIAGLEVMYDGLTELAQLEFETASGEIFNQARARLDYLKGWNETQSAPRPDQLGKSPSQEINSLSTNLIFGSIVVTTLLGYYFLKKKFRI